MIIRGNVLSINAPRTDYAQTDPKEASYLINRPEEAIRAARETAEAALPKGGGTMTGDIAMGGKKVSGLGDPVEDGDAVHKKYVHGYVDGKRAVAAAVLTAAGWASNVQTVAVAAVTANNTILVTPAPESYVVWGESVVYCTAQGEGTLTFACDEVPGTDLTANILIMN